MKMIEALKKVLELADQTLKTTGSEEGENQAYDMVEEIVDAVESGETGKLGAFLYWVTDK